MKVRFWGTRGSLPKPGPSTLRYGGNTSCVEVCSAAGTRIILDCGSGAQDLGQAIAAAREAPLAGHILISHTHWDHIQGLPFFAPLFLAHNHWDIYGPHGFCHSLKEALAGQMQSTYFPISLEHFAAATRYHDLVEGVLQIGEVSVRAQYLNHPALTLGYRLEVDGVVVVYACDHEPYARTLASGAGEVVGQDRHHLDFLREADLVIHDAQYTVGEYPAKVGWGHSTVEYVIHLCRLAGVKRVALTHHDPLRSDTALDQIVSRFAPTALPLEVLAAAEGQELGFPPQPGTARPERPRYAPAVQPPALPEQAILLVAAEASTTSALAEALEADRVRVIQAEDAAAALRSLETEHPSLVVLEHRPPRVDAPTVGRALRARHRQGAEVPIVAVTSERDAPAGASDGVSDWLVEPYSPVYARTKLHAWLMRTACRWDRAPTPPNERQRLAALHKLGILDTPPEDRFDRIVRLAAALFDVPIVLVSLIDQGRQWFKSCHGLEIQETSRDLSFCAHAILERDVMVVPDTLLDERFADNPVVVEEPRVRFYAGFPLVVEEGLPVGTLCLADTRPRWLDRRQIALLSDLGQLVQQELSPRPRQAAGSG